MKRSLLYTGTGDTGTTALVGGTRVAKDHPRLQAYGSIDELNSHLGLLAAMGRYDDIDVETARTLRRVQNKMFNIGSHLATPADSPFPVPHTVTADDIAALERQIDRLDSMVPPIKAFILPAGSPAAAQAHVARTVCRRAEREMVSLASTGVDIDPAVMRYVNRLSDYLFILARFNNVSSGIDEIIWDKDC